MVQATQAFLAGDKSLAKELGAKGRQHAQQMQAAHASASEAIFMQRNVGSKSGSIASVRGKQQLHGRRSNVWTSTIPDCSFEC